MTPAVFTPRSPRPASVPRLGNQPQTFQSEIAVSIGAAANSGSLANNAASPLGPAAVGDFVMVAFTWAIAGGNTISTCTDTSGNSWTIVNHPAATLQSGGYCYTIVTTGWSSNSVTATLTAAAGGREWASAKIPAVYQPSVDQHNEGTAAAISVNATLTSNLAQETETIFISDLVRATGSSTVPVWQWNQNFQPVSSATGSGTLDSGVAIGAYDNLSGTAKITGGFVSNTTTDAHGWGILAVKVVYPITAPTAQTMASAPTPTVTVAVPPAAATASASAPIPTVATASGVIFDAATNGAGLTFTHTCTGTNRFLTVGVAIGDTTTTVTGITYATVAMSRIKRTVGAAEAAEIWGLIAPASGSNSVAITLSAGTASAQGAVSFTAADQTTQNGATNGASGSGPPVSAGTVTGPAGGMLVDVVADGNISITTGTQGWNDSSGDGQGYLSATGSSQSIVWTNGGAGWVASVGVVLPVASNQNILPPAATATASAPVPTINVGIPPAAATAAASAPTPTLNTGVAAPAATAAASAPIPALKVAIPPAAATAAASSPTPTVNAGLAAPAATAAASAPIPGLNVNILAPAATASASAPIPTVSTGTTIAAPAATAAASAPVPTLGIGIPPAAATAAAAAPLPALNVNLAAPVATAAASSPLPGVAGNRLQVNILAPAATATASAPVPLVIAGASVLPPAATASASAPVPAVTVNLAPPAATSSASAPLPGSVGNRIQINLSPPAATAAALARLPTIVISGGSFTLTTSVLTGYIQVGDTAHPVAGSTGPTIIGDTGAPKTGSTGAVRV